MSLYEIIKLLEATPGNNDKLAILEQHKDNELLKAFVKATLDPAINYYQSKLPKVSMAGSTPFQMWHIYELSLNLATRCITGSKVKPYLESLLTDMSPEGQELLAMLISRKLGATKVGDTFALKTWPDLFFVPPYQRCSLLDKKTREKFSSQESFFVQTKLDGSFAYIVKWPNGHAEVITRQGSKYPHEFAEKLALGLKPGSVIVGELEVYRGYHDERELLDRKTGNGVLNSILKDGEMEIGLQVQCTTWDLLTTDEFKAGKSSRPYEERLAHLRDYEIPKLVYGQIVLVQTWEVASLEEAFAIYRDHTSRGLEGCVIKLKKSLWKDGTSKDNVKLKLKFAVEMRCVGYYEGEGKAKGMLGGVNLQSEDGLLKCNCGSGFSDKQRKEFFDNPSLILDKIMEIEANDITVRREEGSIPALSLPIFCEVRSDKPVADTYAQIVAQLEAAKQGT